MEKEEETDSETTKVDWRAWWGIVLLLVVCGFAGMGMWWSKRQIPTSQGMTVSEWLYAKDVSSGATTEEMVNGFGARAIPYFEYQVRNVSETEDKRWDWIRDAAKLVGWELNERAKWSVRFDRAFRALTILGQQHPGRVSDFFLQVLEETSPTSRGAGRAWGITMRDWAIHGLARIGTRHYARLTNMVAGPDDHDSGVAISALGTMGTNASSAVPLIIDRIENPALGNDFGWAHVITLSRIGEEHPRVLPWLFDQLVHTNQKARKFSATALRLMTNSYPRIAPEILRVARLPVTNGIDYGRTPSLMLSRVGVPAELALPVLVKRFHRALEAEKADPDPRRCLAGQYAYEASRYGTNAIEIVPFIKEEYLRRARLPRPPRGTWSSPWSPAVGWLRKFESFLPEIDPSWSRPEIE